MTSLLRNSFSTFYFIFVVVNLLSFIYCHGMHLFH